MERKLRRRKKAPASRPQHAVVRAMLYPWRKYMTLSMGMRIAVVAVPLVLILFVVPFATYMYYANDISDRERLMNRNNTGIVITDKKGGVLYSTGRAEKRDYVELDAISPHIKQALIATEDKDFYQHGGFNIMSIGRALLTNISAGDATAYGGSTLTQQLAKNTLLSDNKSFLRKYQELAVSVAIEQQYTKDQILTMYLNSIYYGENAFGIEEAARVYYGKKPHELSLAESAMLIGVLPAPSAYSPISGSMKFAKERQALVLDRMVRNSFITKDEARAARDTKITYAEPEDTQSKAPHFVQMVMQRLKKTYKDEEALRSGYRVQTTLDPDVQKSTMQAVKRAMQTIRANGGSNASVVVLDPTSGEIRALVGSADWQDKKWGKVNMSITPRQPGSSFKPIYTAGALEAGSVTPSTVLKDVPTDSGGYTPKNADKRFRGDISLRRALGQSLNIPSVKVMQKYGISKSVAYAKKMGLSIDENRQYGLSLALGSSEVSLLEMTNAYAAFAHQGNQYINSSIQVIKNRYGKEVFRNQPQAKRVVSAEAAYLISSILSDGRARAPVFGNSLTLNGRAAAVKTGTTDDSRDAWTIGYTPQLVVGVWVGNNNNETMRRGGAALAGPIWKSVMNAHTARSSGEIFARPSGIVARDTCRYNGGLVSNGVRDDGVYSEVYAGIHLPTVTCAPKRIIEIKVCGLEEGKVLTIDEDTFDESAHSKDLEQCEKQTMCDIDTGQKVQVLKKDKNIDQYTEVPADGVCRKPSDTSESDNADESGAQLPAADGVDSSE